jgi:hypothetical protein
MFAAGLLAKVLIPRNNECLAVCLNEIVQLAQLATAEPTRIRQRDRRQPKLGVPLRLLDVDMMRLRSFPTEKEESVPSDPQDFRHAPRNETPRTAGRSLHVYPNPGILPHAARSG